MAKKILAFLIAHLHPWAYPVLFLVTFLEASAFLGMVVPGDTVVVISGFLAYRRLLRLPLVFGLSALGAVIGDSVGYYIGRRYGRPFMERHGRRFHIRRKQLDRAEEFLKKHGGPALVFGRFTAYVRTFIPVLAGISRMRYPKFLAFNVLGGMLWAGAFTALGYLGGEAWERVGKIAGFAGIALAAAVVIVIVVAVVRRRKRKRKKTGS